MHSSAAVAIVKQKTSKLYSRHCRITSEHEKIGYKGPKRQKWNMISQILTPRGSHGTLGRTIAKDLGMRRNDRNDTTNTEWQEFLLPAQKHSLGNCEETVVQPIDWKFILAFTEPPNTPKKVRQYLAQIVQNMNAHFSIHMAGPDIGKIQVERDSRSANKKDTVLLRPWRCQQLFPRRVTCRWIENGKPCTLFKPVIDIWLASSSRREILPTVKLQHPVYLWLKAQVSMPDAVALIDYGRLNLRKPLYESYLASVLNPEDWISKRFWQSLYKILPEVRPPRNRRIRLKGEGAVFMPSRDDIIEQIGAFSASEAAQLHF